MPKNTTLEHLEKSLLLWMMSRSWQNLAFSSSIPAWWWCDA